MPRIRGIKKWGMSRDKDFYRDYTLSILIELDLPELTGSSPEGPWVVANTPGLPQVGDLWNFNDDTDVWAYCRAVCEFNQYGNEVPNQYFLATYHFSTRPDHRCNETQMEDPLLEPPKLSGSFTKYTVEATQDRFGLPITNSAWEQIRGPQVTFDANRSSVRIEMPTPTLQLQLVTSLMDNVNLYPMWGQAARCIKLSNASWEQVFFGYCYVYYRWNFEFDVDPATFDRNLVDQGTKALHGYNQDGKWVVTPIGIGGPPLNLAIQPDPSNPLHFVQYRDVDGDATTAILNGAGVPISGVGSAFTNPVTYATGTPGFPGAPIISAGPISTSSGQPFTLPVNSTIGFPTPGSITITVWLIPAGDPPNPIYGQQVTVTVDYTGISGNSLTGCTISNFPSWYNPLMGNFYIFGDAAGGPSSNQTATTPINLQSGSAPGNIHVEYYPSGDLTMLGVPLVLDPYSGL